MRRGDIADLTAFIAIADHLSFRAAATQLRVTPSALSHAMRELEERLDTRLLNRTTRSVSLTSAGERLLQRLRPAIAQISTALEDLDRERGRPSGRLRLTVSAAAGAAVAQLWSRFLTTYPEIELEIQLDNAPIDIVAKGFDAGIRSHDQIPEDMIAVRMMGPSRVVVVGSPQYFALHTAPRTPDDLASHSCIQYRLAADGPLHKWTFKRDGRAQHIAVNGRVIVNNPELAVRAALDGLGLAYTLEGWALPFVRSGQLIRVLDDWSPEYEGLALYYPGHRQVPPALRALIELIQATRASVVAKNLVQNPFLVAGEPARERAPSQRARRRAPSKPTDAMVRKQA